MADGRVDQAFLVTARSSRRVRAAGQRERDGVIEFLLEDAVAHKLVSVLRLGPGDAVTVLDDDGGEHACRIASLERGRAVAIAEPVPAVRLPEPWPVTLGIALIKGERFDWAVEKASELGVARILPVACERSQAKDAGHSRQERWSRIAEAAALQSGRARPALVLAPAPSVERALATRREEQAVSMSESPRARATSSAGELACWHGQSGGQRVGELDRSVHPAPRLVIVGPEGGWSDAEQAILEASSTPIDLGPFTLRTETAAIALAFSAIQFISK